MIQQIMGKRVGKTELATKQETVSNLGVATRAGDYGTIWQAQLREGWMMNSGLNIDNRCQGFISWLILKPAKQNQTSWICGWETTKWKFKKGICAKPLLYCCQKYILYVEGSHDVPGIKRE